MSEKLKAAKANLKEVKVTLREAKDTFKVANAAFLENPADAELTKDAKAAYAAVIKAVKAVAKSQSKVDALV